MSFPDVKAPHQFGPVRGFLTCMTVSFGMTVPRIRGPMLGNIRVGAILITEMTADIDVGALSWPFDDRRAAL